MPESPMPAQPAPKAPRPRLQLLRGEALEPPPLDADALAALEAGAHADPFAILGPHRAGGRRFVRAYLPGALGVDTVARDGGALLGPLLERGAAGLFAGFVEGETSYDLRIEWPGETIVAADPYAFGPCLSDFDLHLISEGRHLRLWESLGARYETREGVEGVRFAVWAPNARRCAVVGDFNIWDARRHPMRLRHDAGVWELFVPGLRPGERYKYAISGADGELLPFKADPVALQTETPPATASVVAAPLDFAWSDDGWMAGRAARHRPDAPISIYEVHPGSWLRVNGAEPDWTLARERLIPYVRALGFTHIELLPIAEYPFGGSWGYQPLSLFAPTARHGAPADFAAFVDACHGAGLGVIIDWVPAHFPGDAHGLARFDGAPLYEHGDPREGVHPDWNTLIYNYGRREVSGFLTAGALRWLEDFHVDGLRVDAVASMLYRDYSRKHGEWTPNIHGGRENLEAVAFLRHLNGTIAARFPGVMMIAEESTAWPGVTAPAEHGGLGFQYKWNMGWMNDTLRYMEREPIHRRWHHGEMTFGLVYAFSEKFILPLSHDETAHGKKSLLSKMPGDDWQQRAGLRAYLAFMWMHPGKKLLFMGGEFGQRREWNHDAQLDWPLLEEPGHAGILALTRALNLLYAAEPALHRGDARADGFEWLIAGDESNSVFAFMRAAPDAPPIAVIVNMTPAPRLGYRAGVPVEGYWTEILNTDAASFGGSNLGNFGGAMTNGEPAHGHGQSLTLTLPPLAALVLKLRIV